MCEFHGNDERTWVIHGHVMSPNSNSLHALWIKLYVVRSGGSRPCCGVFEKCLMLRGHKGTGITEENYHLPLPSPHTRLLNSYSSLCTFVLLVPHNSEKLSSTQTFLYFLHHLSQWGKTTWNFPPSLGPLQNFHCIIKWTFQSPSKKHVNINWNTISSSTHSLTVTGRRNDDSLFVHVAMKL